MERNEISLHELKVFVELQRKGDWMTSKDVAAASGVADRTARAHCLRLVKLGILDQAEVFPAHRYRLSTKAAKRNVSYVQRLTNAMDAFGMKA